MPIKNDFTIFLVDTDLFFLRHFEHILHTLGYDQLRVFSREEDCLNELQAKPDVIFLNHTREGNTAYEFLKKIKRYNPNVYVVLVSSQEEINNAVDALKHGAFEYILKGNKQDAKIKEVLLKIMEVKELLQRSRPNLIRKLFHLL